MHKIEFPDLNKTISIPECLDEYTDRQFVFLVGKLLEMHEGKLSEEDVLAELVFKFLGIRKRKRYKILPENVKEQISENVAKLSELIGYLFVKSDNEIRIDYTTTRNFVPVIRTSFFRRIHGPANALTDITFLQYKDANIFYRNYIESQDESDLNRMVAVLYRRKNIFGKKIKYDPSRLEHDAMIISKVPFKFRFAVFLFFVACEEFLHKNEITIDGQQVDLNILYEKTLKEKQKEVKQKYEANTGLAGVAFSLASTGIFGPIEKVYQQNLYDVLLLLYKQRIEYLNDLEKL